ncbi:MAG: helix-turn-helix transcriptional regulator [Lachnospiraceae bacterium]|nr:helix-turn-helix transcriptional regulator [Lachnospiraceae bacterium]
MNNVNPEEYDEFSDKRENHIDYGALGRRVKKLRKEQDIRQADLADALGISYQYMSMIETGKRQLSLSLLVDLANQLGATTDELLYGSLDSLNHKYDQDMQDIMEDCTAEERNILLTMTKSAKFALRAKK